MSGSRRGVCGTIAREWAKENLEGVREVLLGETRSDRAGISDPNRSDFHRALAPDLWPERVGFFRQQKNFQLGSGFLGRGCDEGACTDRRPLKEAWRQLERDRPNIAAA